MSEVVHEYRMRPHQQKAMESQKRHVALFCGVGAGKTDISGLWTYHKLGEAEEWPSDMAQGILAANTYDQLYDSTLRNMFSRWRGFGIRFRPDKLPKAHRPLELEFEVQGTWRTVLCRSLTHPDSLAGLEVGFVDVDEAFATEASALNTLDARCRAKWQPLNQLLYTTTVDDPSSFLYDMFVDGYDPAIMDVIYAPTWENAPNLPDDYVSSLKRMYSERMFQRMVGAKWVSLESGQVYYAFDREENVSEHAEFDPALPVHWSHDQNIKVGSPMSSVCFQVKRTKGPDGKQRHQIHVFDEIVVEGADTNDVIEELQGRDWFSSVSSWTVGGDAAGRARDTRSKQTDYTILAAAGFRNLWAPKQNPPVRERHNTVNARFKSADGDRRILIHPRCSTLIKGCETVRMKPGANYLEIETREQHVTTALGYGVCAFMPITPKRKPRKRRVVLR